MAGLLCSGASSLPATWAAKWRNLGETKEAPKRSLSFLEGATDAVSQAPVSLHRVGRSIHVSLPIVTLLSAKPRSGL
jgi:hypothetical protein